MEMTRRQFLRGLVQVAAVVTSVCLVPDCLPLADPHKPQPIKVQKWRIYGATHTSLLQDGDTIWMNGLAGECIKVERVNGETLEVTRAAKPMSWQDSANTSRQLNHNRAWFFDRLEEEDA